MVGTINGLKMKKKQVPTYKKAIYIYYDIILLCYSTSNTLYFILLSSVTYFYDFREYPCIFIYFSN